MSRSTIDFGIDLGTTNSAIACAENSQVTVIRNNRNLEVTPSVVRIDSRGAIFVGQKAYEQLEFDPENTAAEFKRLMGTQGTKTFQRSRQTWTPEQLSAEVLKSLRQDVKTWCGEDLTAAVITVPAMFELPQCEATQRAARLAGIEYAPLLQEPVAAAIACGGQSEVTKAFWLVYDLGGGTFDTSIVEVHQGRLRVIDHSGDNYLGGKELDKAIVDWLVVRLRQEFSLPHLSRDNPAHRGIFARLKYLAEDARIQLSRVQTYSIEIAGNMGQDEDGRPIETFVELTRAHYEQMARPYIEKTIDISRRALQAAGLEPAAIERVILVGGPTLTPLVREMLQAELRIPLDTRHDPLTIVACGAARFAATQRMPASASHVAPQPGTIPLTISHPATTSDTSAVVGLRVDSVSGLAALTVELVRDDGGWASGRLPLSEGKTIVRVSLRARAANTFAIHLQDHTGRVLGTDPASFTIIQGLAELTAVLSRSLGVVVVDEDEAETEVVLPKGSSLPASQRKVFRSRQLVRARTTDELKIIVVEGEHRRGIRNRHIGTITLRGTDLPRDLPAGHDIEITFRIDASRAFEAEMFIPYLDWTASEVIHQKYSPLPVAEDLTAQLATERERARQLGALLDERTQGRFIEVEQDVEAALGGDPDAGERAYRRLQDLAATLDELEERDELPRLHRQISAEQAEVEEMVSRLGDAGDHRRLRALEEELAQAEQAGDARRLRRCRRELFALRFELLDRQPGFWEGLFQHLAAQASQSTNPAQAMAAVHAGQAAIQLGDRPKVRDAVLTLYALLPISQAGEAERLLQQAGLRRR